MNECKKEKRGGICFYNCDNIEFMKTKPDNYYDLAIVDPPYGIDIAEWDKETPTDEYFKELFRTSKKQIIWGGNYFNLPIQRAWICWDKSVIKAGYLGKREFDEFELAWTNFDCKCKMVRFSDIGNMSGFDGKLKINYKMKAKIHPTQKHVNIYRWLLQNYAEKGMSILDTHGGSHTNAIACDMEDFELDIVEIDQKYFADGLNAFDNYKRQLKLF